MFIVFILTAIISCSESNYDCPATLDVIKFIEKKSLDQNQYYLVQRITGWQDKILVIQLFDIKPAVDPCNRDLIKPIFEDSLETDKVFNELVVDLKNNTFEIKYKGENIKQDKESKLRFIKKSNGLPL